MRGNVELDEYNGTISLLFCQKKMAVQRSVEKNLSIYLMKVK